MTVQDDYSISPALARASGLLVLDWEESSGRPLSAVSAKQLSAFGVRADEGGALHLADILTLSGAQLLDAQLAESTRGDDLQGVIAGLRLPTKLPLPDGLAESVVQSEWNSAWWDFSIDWTRKGCGAIVCRAVVSDASEAVVTERETRIQRERYALAVDNSRLGTWEWDPSSGELEINSHWIQMLGEPFETATLTVDEWERRVHPDDVAATYADINAHIEGKTAFYENVHRMWHVDGHWVHILDRGRAVERDSSGAVTLFTGTHTDITAQKEAEIAARAAAQAKSLFLATMSHEIRTPLHGVLGMIQVLEGTGLSKDQEDALGFAAASGEHLLALINDILDISKIEAGQFRLDSQPFELHSWIESIGQLFRARASEKQLSFEVESCTGRGIWIEIDDHRLRQVANNLVSNAIKFTAEGGIGLAADLTADRSQLTLRVTDTGKGIADLAGIWACFHQEDPSISRSYGGTGLGLSLSRQIVECMGGTIDVASTVGEGSTFTVTIPVRPAAAPPSAEADSAPSKLRSYSSLHVLVAEDNPVNRRVAKGIFARVGIEVEFAVNGLEAVERCRESRFDVVFMDLHMPVMDGLKATTQILNEHGASAPHIVPLTADVSDEPRARCAAMGVTQFLTKPFRVVDLTEILQTLTSQAAC